MKKISFNKSNNLISGLYKTSATFGLSICLVACPKPDLNNGENPDTPKQQTSDPKDNEKKIIDLENQLATKEQELQASKKGTKIPELEGDIKSLRNNIAAKESEIITAKAEVTNLSTQVQALKTEKDQLNTNISDLKNELINKEAELNKAVNDHNSKIQEKELDIKTKNENIAHLSQELSVANAAKKSAEGNLLKLQQKVLIGKGNAEAMKQKEEQINLLNNEIQNTKDKLVKVEKEKQDIEKQKLKATTDSQNEIANLQNEIANLQNEIENIKKEKDKLQNNVKDVTTKIKELNETLEKEKQKSKKLEEELAKQKQEASEEAKKIKEELNQEKERNKELTENLKNANKTKNTNGQVSILRQELIALENKFIKLDTAETREGKGDENKKKNTELENLKNEIKEKREEMNEAKENDIEWLKSPEKIVEDTICQYSNNKLKHDEVEYALLSAITTLGENTKLTGVECLCSRNGLAKIDASKKFHDIIDNKPNILIICKINPEHSIGVFVNFSLKPETKYRGIGEKTYIARFDGDNKVIFHPKTNAKYGGAYESHDQFFLSFGNAELRVRHNEKTLFSNFGIENSYFDNRGHKVNTLLSQGVKRECEIEDYYIFSLQTN